MTALVVHVAESNETKTKLHFIWICDIQEESLIRDPVYDLQIGHFFEGEFEKKKYGRWEFMSYIKEVEGLIEGNINQICGRIELIVPINHYEQQSDSSECPIVHADYLGEIVLEKELSASDIKIGDFMKATLTPQNRLTNYEVIDYPFTVTVKGNFATIKFASATATRDEKGNLVFQTKSFGPVQSLKQDIPLGFYDILIKAVDSTTNYNITLCAEPLATAKSPVAAENYEINNSKLFPKNVSPINRSELPNLPVSSMNSNIPRPTSTNSYSYISSTDSMKTDYVELRNCVSTRSELSLGELISALPVLDSSAPPTPKPRTITPVPMPGNQSKLKPILKVPPTKPTAVPIPAVKTMKAFVHSVLDHQNKKRMHFLWICDIKQDSVLKFPITPLQIGHFFEGVFKQQV
ncbi:hypothetical protein CAEBREN_18611 [Caenorhabditis brenneri]|uniref:Uncharacterized protein n=1 Tax=Caenorhabditis brenneri TaxID=135651 RepID=G0NW34_CAEBE|nr:hypothetical protein CAEBREN_18611 [Caenorhabditis brenneri]